MPTPITKLHAGRSQAFQRPVRVITVLFRPISTLVVLRPGVCCRVDFSVPVACFRKLRRKLFGPANP